MSDSTNPSRPVGESATDLAFERYRSTGDVKALAAVFDRTAADLHRVARHLVGDRSTADDLVQVTFLCALEGASTFEPGRPVVPWLQGILRKQAALVHRRRRTIDPTRLPPAGTTEPSAAAIAHEIDECVSAAMASLPDAYREVVALRLQQDLDAATIATRLGRPAGTVRTQIVRGLEKLRALLPVGVTGVLAGLLPSQGLAVVRARVLERAARRGAAGLAATGLACSLRHATLAVLGATALVAVGLVVRFGAGAQDPIVPPVAAASAHGIPEPPPAPESPQPPTPAANQRIAVDQRAVAAPLELQGTVRGPDGASLANAEVMAWGDRATPVTRGEKFDWDPQWRTTTDSSGRFDLTLAADRFHLVACNGELLAASCISGHRDGRNRIAGLELSLQPTGIQQGCLLDADGRPIADFDIRGYGPLGNERLHPTLAGIEIVGPPELRGTTDARGRFAIRALRSREYSWEVLHPQHPRFHVRHSQENGFLELRLQPGDRVLGQVFRADGSPAAAATVEINDHPHRRTLCDAKGSFELRGVKWQETLYLLVQDPQSAVCCLQPLPRPGTPLVVRLQRPALIQGRVVDDGGVVLGARLRIVGERRIDLGQSSDEPITWEYLAGTHGTGVAADGTFTFGRLNPGNYRIDVLPPGAREFLPAAQVAADTVDLQIRMADLRAKSITLTGRCFDQVTKAPIAAFSLIVQRPTESAGVRVGQEYAFDTRDGIYEIGMLAPGPMLLEFRAPGHATRTLPERGYAPGRCVVDVELLAQRDVELRVTGSEGEPGHGWLNAIDGAGEPILVPIKAGTSSALVPLRDGRALLRGLPAEIVTLRLQVDGYDDPIERQIDLRTQPTGPIPIALTGARRVRIPVSLCFWNQDADPSLFHGASRPNSGQRDLDVVTRVWLRDSSGRQLAQAVLEPGQTLDGVLDPTAPCVTTTVTDLAGDNQVETCDRRQTRLTFVVHGQDLVVEAEAAGYHKVSLPLTRREVFDLHQADAPLGVHLRQRR